jgi:CheY-like chemotaxis protein
VKKLRILLADDHALVRRGARALLNSRHGWRVVGEAANGCEAVQKTIQLEPDVAVLDISMPELNGVEAVCQIRELVADRRDECGGLNWSDTKDGHEPPAGFVLMSGLLDQRIGLLFCS